MPAKKLLNEFPFDPSTFNWDEFKKKLDAEIDSDTDLSNAALTGVTEERNTLRSNERDLKIRLFDATIGKQGPPVTPNDSPAAPAGDNGPAPAVPDSDIFG